MFRLSLGACLLLIPIRLCHSFSRSTNHLRTNTTATPSVDFSLLDLQRIMEPFGLSPVDNLRRRNDLENTASVAGLDSMAFISGTEVTWGDFLKKYNEQIPPPLSMFVDDLLVLCLVDASAQWLQESGHPFEECIHGFEQLDGNVQERIKGSDAWLDYNEHTTTHGLSNHDCLDVLASGIEQFFESVQQLAGNVGVQNKIDLLQHSVQRNPLMRGLFKYTILKSDAKFAPGQTDELVFGNELWEAMSRLSLSQSVTEA